MLTNFDNVTIMQILTLILLWSFQITRGKDLYIDPSNNEMELGTQNNPFKTFSNAINFLSVSEDLRFLFKGGTIHKLEQSFNISDENITLQFESYGADFNTFLEISNKFYLEVNVIKIITFERVVFINSDYQSLVPKSNFHFQRTLINIINCAFRFNFLEPTGPLVIFIFHESKINISNSTFTSNIMNNEFISFFQLMNNCYAQLNNFTLKESKLLKGAIFFGTYQTNITIINGLFMNNTLLDSFSLIRDFEILDLINVDFLNNSLALKSNIINIWLELDQIWFIDTTFQYTEKIGQGASIININGKNLQGRIIVNRSEFLFNNVKNCNFFELSYLEGVLLHNTSIEDNRLFHFFFIQNAISFETLSCSCSKNNKAALIDNNEEKEGGCFHLVNIFLKSFTKMIIYDNLAKDTTAGIYIEDKSNLFDFSINTIRIIESSIQLNIVQYKDLSNIGAGLYLDSRSDLIIENSKINKNKLAPPKSENTLIRPGGPCLFSKSSQNNLLVIGSDFIENFSRHYSACIMFNGVNLTIQNSSFVRNQPIITNSDYTNHANLILYFPSIFDYLSNSLGGAINTLADNLVINATAFIGNKAFRGAVLFINGKEGLSSLIIVVRNCLIVNSEGSKGIVLYHISRFNYLFYSIVDSIVMNNKGTESALFFGDMGTAGVKILHAHGCFFSSNVAEFNVFSQFLYPYVEFTNCIISFNSASSNRVNYPSSVMIGIACGEISDHLYAGNTYYGNTVTSKCGVFSVWNCKARFLNDRFLANFANNNAGAIFVFDRSVIQLVNVTFNGNSVQLSGGCIFSSDQVIIKISNSSFRSCSAGIKGGALYIRESRETVIEDTIFEKNTAYTGSVLSGFDNKVFTFVNCSFKSNNANLELLEIKNSVFFFTSCFIDNPGYNLFNFEGVEGVFHLNKIVNAVCRSLYIGCVMSVISGSNIAIKNSFIDFSSSSVIGGALYISNSNMTIYEVIMSNTSSAIDASCLLATDNSNIKIEATNFSEYSKYCIYGQEATISINNSNFLKKNTVYNYLDSFDNDYHGSLFCSKCITVLISFSLFTGGSSNFGGGLQIYNSKYGLSLINCSFVRNLAGVEGGALYVVNTNLYVSSTEFIGNSAGISGGAIYFSSDQFSSYNFTVYLTKFHSNNAKLEGGAIKWLENKPKIENCNFQNNSAQYGEDLAAFPIRLNLKIFLKDQNIDTDIPILDLYHSKNNSYNNLVNQKIAPGQKFPIIIKIEVLDIYGQIVSSLNDEIVEIKVVPKDNNITSKPYLLGATSISTNKGSFSLDNLQIFSEENKNNELQLTVPSIVRFFNNLLNLTDQDRLTEFDKNDRGNYKFVIYAGASACPNGTIFNPEISSCLKCPFNFISLSPKLQDVCVRCPTGALCPGGAIIYSKQGYWLPSNFSIKPVECPEKDYCIDGPPLSCRNGHQGPVCMGCIVNYDRNPFGSCVECSNNMATLYIQIIGYFLILVIVSTFMIRASFRNVRKVKARSSSSMTIKQKRSVDRTGRVSIMKIREIRTEDLNSMVDDHSIYYKILLNYLQLLGIVRSLPMKWPDYFKNYFNSFRFFNLFSVQFFSLECLIRYTGIELEEAGNGKKLALVFLEGILLNLTVVFYFLLLCLVFYIYSLFKRKSKISKNILISFLILYDMIQPTLVQENAKMFLCIEVEGKYYLESDANISCDTDLYKYLTNFFFLIFLLIWTLLIPGSIFYHLRKNRYRLNDFKIFSLLGSYYIGYQQKYYFWDFIIMARENIVIFITMLRVSDELKIHFVLILLSISFFLQLTNQPLIELRFNHLEQLALTVTLVTVFSGLLYISGSSEELTLVSVIFMIGLNVLFICIWGRGFFKTIIIKLVFPLIMKSTKNEKLQGILSRYMKTLNIQKTMEDSAPGSSLQITSSKETNTSNRFIFPGKHEA